MLAGQSKSGSCCKITHSLTRVVLGVPALVAVVLGIKAVGTEVPVTTVAFHGPCADPVTPAMRERSWERK